jgi:hypothetical protein
MFAGQAKCRMRQNGQQAWEVEIHPGRWHPFPAKADADLVASAGQLFCDPKPSIGTMRATAKAMEDAGVCRDRHVLVVYTNLLEEVQQPRQDHSR